MTQYDFMGIVLKSEREAWGREGGDKVEAAVGWGSDTGVGETDESNVDGWGDREYNSTEWDLKSTRTV